MTPEDAYRYHRGFGLLTFSRRVLQHAPLRLFRFVHVKYNSVLILSALSHLLPFIFWSPADPKTTVTNETGTLGTWKDELASFVRAFGGRNAQRPTGQCEMTSLTPDGFVVRAALFPDEPVSVTFPIECLCAQDFQQQILAISKQAMMIV